MVWIVVGMYEFVVERYGDHQDLHVLTPSFPTRRSADRGASGRRADEDRARGHAALASGAGAAREALAAGQGLLAGERLPHQDRDTAVGCHGNRLDRKSTRLNSSH